MPSERASSKAALEFFRQDPQVDDDAEIVKQSRQIGLAGIGIGNLAGEVAADQSASQRVFPEGDRIDAAPSLGIMLSTPQDMAMSLTR